MTLATKLLLGLSLLAAPAMAQDASPAAPEENTALACLNAGMSYSVGEFACIAACHQQRRLARCDVVSESLSWTYVSDACPSAMIINPRWPSDWTEVPAVAAMSPMPMVVTYSVPPAEMPATLTAYLN